MKNLVYLFLLFIFVSCSFVVEAPDQDDEISLKQSSSSQKKSSSSKKVDNKSSSSNKSNNSSSSQKVDNSSSSTEAEDSSSSVKTKNSKAWQGEVAKKFAGGMGTKSSPYIIETAEELAYLAYITNSDKEATRSVYYKLASDIYLNDGEIIDENGKLIADTTELYKWTPIGTNTNFLGYFDGDYHIIEGLFISTTNDKYGLFGTNGGKISNLTLKNSTIKGKDYIGAIAGFNYGVIENVINEATVNGNNQVGGIVGNTQTNNSSTNTIFKSNGSVINNCVNNGIVSGASIVGGIVGCSGYSSLENLSNNGTINSTKEYCGGILGQNYYGNAKISKSENNGEINGVNFVGGITGGYSSLLLSSHSSQVIQSKNFGSISGSKYVAGIVAYALYYHCENLANFGMIKGDSSVAGILGYAKKDTLINVYNLGEIKGSSYTAGITGDITSGVFASVYNAGEIDCKKNCGAVSANISNTIINAVYYLETSFDEPFHSNDGGGNIIKKSKKEMQSSDFVELLGDGFVYSKNEYPNFKK